MGAFPLPRRCQSCASCAFVHSRARHLALCAVGATVIARGKLRAGNCCSGRHLRRRRSSRDRFKGDLMGKQSAGGGSAVSRWTPGSKHVRDPFSRDDFILSGIPIGCSCTAREVGRMNTGVADRPSQRFDANSLAADEGPALTWCFARQYVAARKL